MMINKINGVKQEALEEREKQIQSLLAEREFEQAEVASATSQVAKVLALKWLSYMHASRLSSTTCYLS